ncbi:MAG TPA: hypothetical protein DCP90_05835 [Clostridiales bacterium]|nr:MAG: hypothetical protein A2Y22_04840 [Clostridiales bacterium GWD2_32_59]HAN10114.1 hypothetical protein [Clostridiales bacterium]
MQEQENESMEKTGEEKQGEARLKRQNLKFIIVCIVLIIFVKPLVTMISEFTAHPDYIQPILQRDYKELANRIKEDEAGTKGSGFEEAVDKMSVQLNVEKEKLKIVLRPVWDEYEKTGIYDESSVVKAIVPLIAENINKTAPKMVDEVTRLDGCEAIGNKGLHYKYTLLFDIKGIESEVKEEMKQANIEIYKTHPDMNTLRNAGIIVKYSYYDDARKELFEFSINPTTDFK